MTPAFNPSPRPHTPPMTTPMSSQRKSKCALDPEVEVTTGVTGVSSPGAIYSTLKQSNGSHFLLNRCDHIIIKGLMFKHSPRSKRWKQMYFVLNGTEQMLYFFDNEKVYLVL